MPEYLLESLLFACLLVLICLKKRSGSTSKNGLLEIPGYPLVGNAFQVLRNPSKVFLEWLEHYGVSSFWIKLGSVPVLIVNNHDDIRRLWKGQSVKLNSRPTKLTFHNVVGSTNGFTVGSTPFGESFRRERKCLMLQLSFKASHSERNIKAIDEASAYILRQISNDILKSDLVPPQDIMMLRHFQCFVLRSAVLITYGYHLDTHGSEYGLADRIVKTESHILNYRSIFLNYQDYVPLLHKLHVKEKDAEFWRDLRDSYMSYFEKCFQEGFHAGNRHAQESILADVYGNLPSHHMEAHEYRSICLTMLSAGLDNISFTLNHICGQLAIPGDGYKMQAKLLNLIKLHHGSSLSEAWNHIPKDNFSPYALALIHESLRHLSVMPMSLPRVTTADLVFAGHHIPEGSVLAMNTYSANHDHKKYRNPYGFRPDRWLDADGRLTKVDHLTFGEGSRKCAGDQLSLHEMYVMLCRLVLVFEIRRPKDQAIIMCDEPFKGNANPAGVSFEPLPFGVSLELRDNLTKCELHNIVFSRNSEDRRNPPC